MPLRDGYSLIETIRSRETDSYTFIIVLTIHDELQVLEHCFELGADDFVAKPVQKSELVHRIRAGERLIHQFNKNILVFSLAQMTKLRDFDSGEHVMRIEAYATLLANGLKTNPRFAYQINRRFFDELGPACVLHDIGKVSIDEQILHKPAALCESEWIIMKTHTTAGQSTIESIRAKYPRIGFLKMAGEVARWHHEWFDGSGYPDGLIGDDIPLAARIVALADVYDALVSARSYKRGVGLDEAADIIRNESGTHFDPAIVAIFDQVESQFRTIAQTANDPVPETVEIAKH